MKRYYKMIAMLLAVIMTCTSSGITVLASGTAADADVEVTVVENTSEENVFTTETVVEEVTESEMASQEITTEEASGEETVEETSVIDELPVEEDTSSIEETTLEETTEVATEETTVEETTEAATEETTVEETTEVATEETTVEETTEVETEETTVEETTEVATEETTVDETTTEEATEEESTEILGEANPYADSSTLQAPTVSIGGVTVKSGQTIQDTDAIKLTSALGTTANSKIKIYYTTDGKNPTENSTLYSGTFKLATSGTKTIKAVAIYNGTKSKITSVKVKVNSYVTKFTINTKSGVNIVSSGKKITLIAADFVPAYATKKNVKWEITAGSEYATLSSKGVLTAKKGITANQTVKVKATALDRETVTATITITVIPAVTGLTLKNKEDAKFSMAYPSTKKMEVVVAPAGVNAPIAYTSSKPTVATVSEKGLITAVGSGKTTITAKTLDGSNKSVKMTVTVVKLVDSVTVSSKTGETVIAAGYTLQMVADVTKDATNKAVTWSVSEKEGVSINSKGVLKVTKAVSEISTVTVTAEAKDGSGKKGTMKVKIYPAATSKVKVEGGSSFNVGTKASGDLKKTVQLYPYTDGYTKNHFGRQEGSAKTNLGNFTYKSSKESVATVSATGVVTAVSVGTAKITITARDGSKKKTTVTIKVVNPVTSVSIASNNGVNFVGRTRTLSLKATINSDATVKKLKWTSSNPSVASVNASNGKVTGKSYGSSTAKAVITATATDGSGIKATFTVIVKPKIKKLAFPTILGLKTENVYTRIDVGTSEPVEDYLPVYIDESSSDAKYGTLDMFSYSVTNSKIIEIEYKSGVPYIKAKKVGNAYLTFKSLDGTGKTIKLLVKVQ